MSKPPPNDQRYHRLSAKEKRRRVQAQLHEPPVTCVQCETQVLVGQMPQHLKSLCPGKPREHHLDKWIPFADVIARGIPKVTLSRWVSAGHVRVKGEQGGQLYRVRDLDLMQSRAAARGSDNGTEGA